MASANTEIMDGVVTHSINILRVAAGERKRVLAMLEQLETSLVKDLQDTVGKTVFQQKRLQALLKQTTKTIESAYTAIAKSNGKALSQIAQLEGTKVENIVNGAIGAAVANVGLSSEQLSSIAGKTLIEGKYPAEHWKDQDHKTRDRFATQMREGMLRGEGVDELTRRVRGTKAKGYTDGLMQASKSQASALVRTSVISVSNEARIQAIMSQGENGVVKGIQWIATLDNRTTPICRALDGLQWTVPDLKPVGHAKAFPGPTAHWQCRSTQVPVTRSWAELAGPNAKFKTPDGKSLDEALQKKLLDAGMPADQVAKVKADTRASMDGQVAGTHDFDSWLKTKPESFQDEVLGPQRAAMWRAGQLTLAEMTDQDNNPLTVAELKALVAANVDTAPPTEGENGLSLSERKALEDSMQYGVEQSGILTHYIDQETGAKVTVKGTAVDDQTLAKLNQMKSIHVLQNSLTAGEVWTAQQWQTFGALPTFKKASIVGPTGKVMRVELKKGATFDQPAATQTWADYQALKNTKSIPQTQQKFQSGLAKTGLFKVHIGPAGAVKLPAKTFNQKFPELAKKPAPFFDQDVAAAEQAAKVAETEKKAAAAAKAAQEAATAAAIEEAGNLALEKRAAAIQANAEATAAQAEAIESLKKLEVAEAAAAKKAEEWAKLNADAQKEIADVIANLAGKQLLAKYIAENMKLYPAGAPADILDDAKLKAIAAQAKASTSAALSGYKKKYLAGQAPTPAQVKALESLPADQQKKFLDGLEQTKAAEDAKIAAQETEAKAAEAAKQAAAAAAVAKAKPVEPPPPAGKKFSDLSAKEQEAISDWTSAVAMGHTPDPYAKYVFETLSPTEQAKWKAKADAIKSSKGKKKFSELTPDQKDAVNDWFSATAGGEDPPAHAKAAFDLLTPTEQAKWKADAGEFAIDAADLKPVVDEPAPPRPKPAAKPKPEPDLVPITAPAPKPSTVQFPADPNNLTKVKTLGGSTGAELVKDANGKLWVRKKGASAPHVREEIMADDTYRAMGLNVPEAKLYETATGPVKLAEFIEGDTLADALAKATPAERTRITREIQRGFAADSLMGNWDVAGAGNDNILVGKDGQIWRIDNGGSMRYRAMGTPKTATEWNEYATELWTMRGLKLTATDQAVNTSPQTTALFQGMSIYDIARQIRAIPDAAVDAAPAEVRTMLQARLRNMKALATRALDFEQSKWDAPTADRVARRGMALRERDIVQRMAKQLNTTSGPHLRDENGNDWDHLRSKTSHSFIPAQATMTPSASTPDPFAPVFLNVIKSHNHYAAQAGASQFANPVKHEAYVSAVIKLEAFAKDPKASPAEKALAKHYAPWIEKIKKAHSTFMSTGKHGPAIAQFDSGAGQAAVAGKAFGVAAKPEPPKQGGSLTADVAQYMSDEGLSPMQIASWMNNQAGSSWSTGALPLKYWVAKSKGQVDFFWLKGNKSAKAAYDAAAKEAGGADKLDATFETWHAYTQELLTNTAMPNKDDARRLVRLIRTEEDSVWEKNGIQKDKFDTIHTIDKGASESHSIMQITQVYGDHISVQAVPFVDIFGLYITEKPGVSKFDNFKGDGGPGFAGDGENEFVANSSGIPMVYAGRSQGTGRPPKAASAFWMKNLAPGFDAGPDASKWGVPIDQWKP